MIAMLSTASRIHWIQVWGGILGTIPAGVAPSMKIEIRAHHQAQ